MYGEQVRTNRSLVIAGQVPLQATGVVVFYSSVGIRAGENSHLNGFLGCEALSCELACDSLSNLERRRI